MLTKPLIAVVEDDESVREATLALLRSNKFIAKGFASAGEFLASSRLHITSCLIADMQMPGMTGLALYGRLIALRVPIPTILITAYPQEAAQARALDAGVIGYLCKPFSEKELLHCIRLAFRQTAVLAPLK